MSGRAEVVSGGEVHRSERLLVATRNAGKLAELRGTFAALGYVVEDLESAAVVWTPGEEGVECYESFEENALAKARYFHERSGGLTTLADDSGLEVLALGGAPGVRSRRWSGVDGSEAEVVRANNAKLLAALEGVLDRRARFVCAVALVDRSVALVDRGEIDEVITHAPRGENGFGYDPLFECPELGGRTFAEASSEDKARVSHRGRALTALVRGLRAHLLGPAG